MYQILVDGREIRSDEAFIIKSFENYYESKYTSDLLIHKDLKQYLEEKSKLKIEKFH